MQTGWAKQKIDIEGEIILDLNTLEKNVTLLPTPYCDFSVSDEEGNAVIFDIMESPEKNSAHIHR